MKRLRQGDFQTLQRLVRELTGMHLGPNKQDLAAGRLFHRLRVLGLNSLEEYLPRVCGPGADPVEQTAFVNSFTTNKTDFFREAHHFEFLREKILPGLSGGGRIWSAGCSTGEEPYSIAMTVLEHFGGKRAPVKILASDIDTHVLAHTARGVYDDERVSTIPEPLRAKYLLRGVGRSAGTWRVTDEVRALVEVKQVNLARSPWPVPGKLDAIFCRNLLIYFDKAAQAKMVNGFAAHLAARGHLFLGHSESLLGAATDLVAVGPTVYEQKARLAPVHKLGMGEIFVSAEPTEVVTLLGSCVSVCLFDASVGVGGMSHYVTPDIAGGQTDTWSGAQAIPALLQRLQGLGAQQSRLAAKIVGAGSVVPAISETVPLANLRYARARLAAEGIRVVGERVGGTRPLEAHFFTAGGRLRCREVGDGRRWA